MDSKRHKRTQVKLLRHKLNLTQEEFANLLGVSWVTVARWEMKKGSAPSRLAMEKINKLGMPS